MTYIFNYLHSSNKLFLLNRFELEPFVVNYTVETKASQSDDWEFASNSKFDDENFPYLCDSLQGGQCFFDDIEITFNNSPIETSKIAKFHNYLTGINKSMACGADLLRRYGRPMNRIRKTQDRIPAAESVGAAEAKNLADQMNKTNERLKDAFEPLMMDSKSSSTCTSHKSLPFGYCATFPFSAQLNATRAWTGQKFESGYLPPGISCSVRLTRKQPLEIALERADISDADRIKDKDYGEKFVRIKLKEVFLNYHSVLIHDEKEIESIRRSELIFMQDNVDLQTQKISSGVRYDQALIRIPAECLGVFIFFYFQTFMYPDAKKNQFQTNRRIFCPHLDKLTFDIAGRPGLLLSEGISNLTGSHANGSNSLRQYHKSLVRAGLYDQSFNTFAPSSLDGSTSYDQVILLDLTKYQMTRPEELCMKMTFSPTANSPSGWFTGSFVITQQRIRWKYNDGFSMEKKV